MNQAPFESYYANVGSGGLDYAHSIQDAPGECGLYLVGGEGRASRRKSKPVFQLDHYFSDFDALAGGVGQRFSAGC